MSASPVGSITALLDRNRAGDGAARDELRRRLAFQMHPIACRLMGLERTGHTLQPTALVNEAVARLLTQEALVAAPSRAYLFAAAARAMRQALVDHARTALADKRGGDWSRVPLSEDVAAAPDPQFGLVELGDAIQALSESRPRAADVVTLRYLAGYRLTEVADMLGVALSTVESDWRFARAWLLRAMETGKKSGNDQGG